MKTDCKLWRRCRMCGITRGHWLLTRVQPSDPSPDKQNLNTRFLGMDCDPDRVGKRNEPGA